MNVGVFVMAIRERYAQVARILERCPMAFVNWDTHRLGAWWNARECWSQGASGGHDWVVLLNDDALPCPEFDKVLHAALTSSPSDVVCLYTNHYAAPYVAKEGAHWYVTPDGLVGVGCAMRGETAGQFLAWAREHDAAAKAYGWTDDGRVNLFAMDTGRLVATTVPSLVDHQLPEESTVGNAHHSARRPTVEPLEDVTALLEPASWRTEAPRVGRMYRGNHWRLMTELPLTRERLQRAYGIERMGVLHG